MESLNWYKSSFSAHNGGCVEIAHLPGGGVGLRDSKDRFKESHQFTHEEWRAFLAGVRAGEFDSPDIP